MKKVNILILMVLAAQSSLSAYAASVEDVPAPVPAADAPVVPAADAAPVPAADAPVPAARAVVETATADAKAAMEAVKKAANSLKEAKAVAQTVVQTAPAA